MGEGWVWYISLLQGLSGAVLGADYSAGISPLFCVESVKGATQPLCYLLWKPETPFWDEFIMQNPSENLGDEREKKKERARGANIQMQQERHTIYLQGWKKHWERGCNKRFVRECSAGDEEVSIRIFCPSTYALGGDTWVPPNVRYLNRKLWCVNRNLLVQKICCWDPKMMTCELRRPDTATLCVSICYKASNLLLK